MIKKSIFSIVPAAVFFLTGCYSTVRLTRDQVALAINSDQLTVLVDSAGTTCEYRTLKGSCRVIHDTLVGTGIRVRGASLDNPSPFAFPLSDVECFKVREIDGAKTVALSASVAAGVALIVVLSNQPKSEPPPKPTYTGTRFSCPLIYTYDGTSYHLESETFAGAVFKGLERTSFDMMYHLKPVDGCYRLNVVNGREETEYINELKLVVVDHDANVTAMPDVFGNIHTISSPLVPINAGDRYGHNITRIVSSEDQWYFESDLNKVKVKDDDQLVDFVTAEFPKPAGALTAKMIVSGLNTQLAYYALERIFSLQGDRRFDWYQQLNYDASERAKFVKWMMREGMLHLSVWNGNAWVERGFIPDVGPGVEKTQVTQIYVGDLPGNTLKIKATFRAGLWRIDRMAVDYSEDRRVSVQEVSAASAIDENGRDVSGLISAADSLYYVTVNGDRAAVIFHEPPVTPGLSRSLIVKTRGFYYQWTVPDETPQPQVVERILTEPLFGSKLLIPLWKSKHSSQ